MFIVYVARGKVIPQGIGRQVVSPGFLISLAIPRNERTGVNQINSLDIYTHDA